MDIHTNDAIIVTKTFAKHLGFNSGGTTSLVWS